MARSFSPCVRFEEIYLDEVNGRSWPVSDRYCLSRSPTGVKLDLRLFRDLQSIVDVDAEVPDSAFWTASDEKSAAHLRKYQ